MSSTTAEEALPTAGVPAPLGRTFRIFWLGQSISFLGDGFTRVALPLVVLQAGGSASDVAFVIGAHEAGMVVAAALSGALVDRLDRRRVLLTAELVRAAAYVTVPLWYMSNPSTLWPLYVVAAVGGALGGLASMVFVSLVPDLVGRAQIFEANGRLQVSMAIGGVLGPFIVGEVATRVGPAWAMGADGLTFLASCVSLLFVPFAARQAAAAEPSGNAFAGLASGARELLAHPTLRAMTCMIMCLVFATAGTYGLFTYRIQEELQRDSRTVGVMFGLAAVGAVVGGMSGPSLQRRLGFGVSFLGGILSVGAAMILGGLARSQVWLTISAILFAFGTTVSGTAAVSLRQAIVPSSRLGRVSGAFWALSMAPAPIGAAVAGAVVARTGTAIVFVALGVLLVILGVAGFGTKAGVRAPRVY